MFISLKKKTRYNCKSKNMPPVKRCRQQVCLGKRCQRQPSANDIHRQILGGGGTCQRTPPLQDPILSFSHAFSLKSAHIGGQTPPKWVHTPPMENPVSGPAYMCMNKTN